MAINAKYVHTNLVARDWKRLADFYGRVFGCTPVPPERHISEDWLAAATGVPHARIRGVHLRLPGYSEAGPTLEIFQYEPNAPGTKPAVNRPGLSHIAFWVEDVDSAMDGVLAAGGSMVGELVTAEIAGVGRITLAYMTDPEGNIIELQKWSD